MQRKLQQQLAGIDEADPGRYLEVPRADLHQGYRDIADFIVTLEVQRPQELLKVAIQGRGAFRRLQDVLQRNPAERQCWFDFLAARLEARARESLAKEGREPVQPSDRK